ncbi:MAG: hypothetical protein R3298_05875 [Gammaproteobacteria bacterium]|nr:hypothetical protein [Gammaproteobacteria bacterium]
MNMARRRILIVLAVAAVVVLGGWLLMPTPISTDLSRVGQDRPSVVLAYENFSPTGGEALARLNAVRGEYEDRIVFALADLGTPQGQAFASRYVLRDGIALVLAADGTVHSRGAVPADPGALRERLDGVLDPPKG